VPGAHGWQVEAPVELYQPRPQPVHTLDELAPVTLLLVPATQALHTERPMDAPNVPGGQGTQADLSGKLYVPTGHVVQTLDDVAPMLALADPAAHCTHTEEPTVDWYLPATQLVHAVEPGCEVACPAAHGKHAADPNAGEYAPGLQDVHACADVCFVLGLAVPGAHEWQTERAVAFPKVPARQSMQTELADPLKVPSGQALQLLAVDAATTVLKYPALHSKQAVAAKSTENFPAAQLLHVDAPEALK